MHYCLNFSKYECSLNLICYCDSCCIPSEDCTGFGDGFTCLYLLLEYFCVRCESVRACMRKRTIWFPQMTIFQCFEPEDTWLRTPRHIVSTANSKSGDATPDLARRYQALKGGPRSTTST